MTTDEALRKEHYLFANVPLVNLQQPLCAHADEVCKLNGPLLLISDRKSGVMIRFIPLYALLGDEAIVWTKIRRDASPRHRFSNVTLLVVYCMASAFVLFYYLTTVSSVAFSGGFSDEVSNYRPVDYESPMDCNHYKDALSKSLLFYEGQRSGKLPTTRRLAWRNDSGVNDGSSANVDLSGGYHDAGDNVKFGFPLAFTVTTLAWSIVENGHFMEKADELKHAHDAVRWGTDYLLKTYPRPNELWAQVGDANADHRCWARPEDMRTPRPAYKVDVKNPGSDLAGETAAALAAASIVFRRTDADYSRQLVETAKEIFLFADTYRGKYSDAVPAACPFYCSYSGYKDELLWGATWLYKATLNKGYLDYIQRNSEDLGGTRVFRPTLDWDNKYAGVQVLLAKVYLAAPRNHHFKQYKDRADELMCATLPGLKSSRLKLTPGGLIHTRPSSNFQYVTTTAFLLTVYSKYLRRSSRHLMCNRINISPRRLSEFAQQQVDYILGSNPNNMSYMVGFGSNYPKQVHHRASSMPSIIEQPTNMTCKDGWTYFAKTEENPNLLVGAVVGGPDLLDKYQDLRWNYEQSEPAIYINAPLTGALAYLYGENSLICDLLEVQTMGRREIFNVTDA